jgi:hypothetical protein
VKRWVVRATLVLLIAGGTGSLLAHSLVGVIQARVATQVNPPCQIAGFPWFGDKNGTTVASPQNRQEFAKYLAKHLRRLHDAVPNLSPAEQQWLAGELNAGNRRMISAFVSVENHKKTVKEYTTERLQSLDQLASGKVVKGEMLTWGAVANSYGGEDFARSVAALVEKKIIDNGFVPHAPDGEGQEESLLNSFCQNTERQIMEHIILPFLRTHSE